MDRVSFWIPARIQIPAKIPQKIPWALLATILICVFGDHLGPLFCPQRDLSRTVCLFFSPTLLNAASSALPVIGHYHYLARFLVSVCGFWSIIGLAFLLSFWHFPFSESKVFSKGLLLFSLSTAFPTVMGVLFHFLTKKRTTDEDLLVYLLGLVFFVSGTTFYFNLPPLYTCMVLGITFSNLTRRQEKLYPLLLSTEKSLYIVFLILIGALWDLRWDYRVAVLVVLLIAVRVISYTLPLPFFKKILGFPSPLPAGFGLCFLSSGGIGIAYAVSFKLAYPLPMADVFLSIALLMVIASELISPWALKFSLLRLDSEEKE